MVGNLMKIYWLLGIIRSYLKIGNYKTGFIIGMLDFGFNFCLVGVTLVNN